MKYLAPGIERSAAATYPTHRGRSHQVALPVAMIGTIAMVVSAQTTAGKVGAAIYGVSLAGLFTSSSLYNRALGTHRFRPWMRWFDHAMIYLLIAGSYTPTCLVSLPRRIGIPLLIIVWTGAIAGVLVKTFWRARARVFGAVLYLAIGWAAIAALPSLFSSLTRTATSLFIVGGILYTVGALTLYLRRPNPRPEVFGYHEVWHLYVVAAAACHFGGNWLALTTI